MPDEPIDLTVDNPDRADLPIPTLLTAYEANIAATERYVKIVEARQAQHDALPPGHDKDDAADDLRAMGEVLRHMQAAIEHTREAWMTAAPVALHAALDSAIASLRER